MGKIVLIALSLISVLASAQPKTPSSAAGAPAPAKSSKAGAAPLVPPAVSEVPSSENNIENARPVHVLLSYGSELRPEKDTNSNFVQHTLTNYAIGFGYEKFLLLFERATFEESSGNSTLSVTRRLEDTMAWLQWRSLKWYRIVPFLGGGAGAYKEKVATNLSGAPSVQSESSHRFLGGVSFGVSLDIPIVWVSVEGRMLFGDELDQQPTLGAVARIGLWF